MSSRVPALLAIMFFVSLFQLLYNNPSIFVKKHGRSHAITGFLYLLWITWGFIEVLVPGRQGNPMISFIVFDVVLGALGTILTLYAAYEFQHKNVTNIASGTLDEHATVTYGEMIEHSFYQALNLVQIVFIHSMQWFSGLISNDQMVVGRENNMWVSHVLEPNLVMRIALLFIVTLPWLVREWFPINKFSDNYEKVDSLSTPLIRLLYRVKKYQYVFYKHFVLHGLNITIAVTGISFGDEHFFRLFWLLLNLSYVMEFFLQTLVKKGYLTQTRMLFLQKVLMTASSIAAISVLRYVNILIALLSLWLNFVHRKHDVYNTMLACCLYLGLCYTFWSDRIIVY
jgi:hypothetical protein